MGPVKCQRLLSGAGGAILALHFPSAKQQNNKTTTNQQTETLRALLPPFSCIESSCTAASERWQRDARERRWRASAAGRCTDNTLKRMVLRTACTPARSREHGNRRR